MPVMVLAEAENQTWLIEGDEHLDALLVDALPDDVAVEFIACDTAEEVYALWRARSLDAEDAANPWAINPLIVARIRRSIGGAREVTFAPWSVMLDEAGQTALSEAASWLSANPAGRLRLRQFLSATPEPGLADLQRLRGQLAIGALQRGGADPARTAEEVERSETDENANRMEIVTEAP